MEPHLRIGSPQDLYQCGVWPESFSLKDKLGAHLRANQNYMSCRCEVCGKLFNRLSDLKTHLWLHSKDKPIFPKTSQRRKNRESTSGVLEPSESRHNEIINHQHHLQLQSSHPDPTSHSQNESHLRIHNETHNHMPNSHLQTNIHSAHVHSESQINLQMLASSEPHSHSQLDQGAVASHSHDQSHTIMCHNQSEQNRKHSPPCDICGKRFAFSNYIKLHATVHSKEKPFPCDLCPKKFSQPSSRNRHRKKSHSGSVTIPGPLAVVPHQPQESLVVSTSQPQPKKNSPPCDVCGKTFAFKNYMKAHSRVHTKIKPYACPICFRRFTQASSRNFHRKRMHAMVENKESSQIEPSIPQEIMQPSTAATPVHDEKPFHCKACVPNYHQLNQSNPHN